MRFMVTTLITKGKLTMKKGIKVFLIIVFHVTRTLIEDIMIEDELLIFILRFDEAGAVRMKKKN